MLGSEQYRLEQIRDIASSEPFGSFWFNLHVGILLLGSSAGLVLVGIWWLPIWLLAYVVLFTLEKTLAQKAVVNAATRTLPLLLSLLLFRVLVYDTLVVLLWASDGDVYKLGATALLVGATVNSFLSQGRFVSTIACVALPNALVFLAIAGLEYRSSGLSAEFAGSMIAALCVIPFLLLSVRDAAVRQANFDRAVKELLKAQRTESMGQIAAGVAHDFNNIVSVISGSLELSKDIQDEAARAKLIDTAKSAADHASNLTKQLLALGKSSPLLPKNQRISDTVSTFASFSGNVLPANIEIVTKNEAPETFVYVDPDFLQSALLNLAINAKAAMPYGGRLSIVSGITKPPSAFPAQHVHDGKCAFVSVADTGSGIAKEHLDRVFEPFFSTGETGQASGLGLSMVKGFAEQSNGTARLTSELGKGTEITLFLPLSANQDAAPRKSSGQGGLAPAPAEMTMRRIVVVEDNDQLRELITIKLERDGFQVDAYRNGDEALLFLKDFSRVDLVITDQVMPGQVQGTDLLKCVKNAAPGLPVILMSGYADTKTDSTIDLDAADLFIEKPVSFAELSDHINDLISKSTRIAEGARQAK